MCIRDRFQNLATNVENQNNLLGLNNLDMAIPDRKDIIEVIIAEGDMVGVKYRITGTHLGNLYGIPATNKNIDIYSIAFYKVEDGMKSLGKLLNESPDFKEMILNPVVSKEDKKNVVFAIADKNNFSQVLKKFLGFLTFKNRLFFIKQIIESFLNLVSRDKGELRAKLLSPKKLSNFGGYRSLGCTTVLFHHFSSLFAE